MSQRLLVVSIRRTASLWVCRFDLCVVRTQQIPSQSLYWPLLLMTRIQEAGNTLLPFVNAFQKKQSEVYVLNALLPLRNAFGSIQGGYFLFIPVPSVDCKTKVQATISLMPRTEEKDIFSDSEWKKFGHQLPEMVRGHWPSNVLNQGEKPWKMNWFISKCIKYWCKQGTVVK